MILKELDENPENYTLIILYQAKPGTGPSGGMVLGKGPKIIPLLNTSDTHFDALITNDLELMPTTRLNIHKENAEPRTRNTRQHKGENDDMNPLGALKPFQHDEDETTPMDIDPKPDQTIDLDIEMTPTAPFVYQEPQTYGSNDLDPRPKIPIQQGDEKKEHNTPETKGKTVDIKSQPGAETEKPTAEGSSNESKGTREKSRGDERNADAKGSATVPVQASTLTKPQRVRDGSPQQDDESGPIKHDQEEKQKRHGRDPAPANSADGSRRQSRSRSSSRSDKKAVSRQSDLSLIRKMRKTKSVQAKVHLEAP
jgi:hypothetical protein